MGDIRNKIAKIERARAEREAGEAWLRRHGGKPHIEPRGDPRSIPCEICGRVYYDVIIYAVKTDMRRLNSPTLYFCEEHLPSDWDDPGWKRAK